MSQRLKDFLSIACMMSGLDTSALVVGIGAVEGHHGYVPSPSSLNNGLPPVASTLEHDEYVSLGISRDSDEDRKKSVYHQTTKQLAKAYAAIMKEEAALSKTIADIRLPSPIPESGVRDIEQALMGDYKDQYYDEETLFRMPEASAFEQRLKSSKLDNLNMESAARKYRFLVPFIIKAELSPGLAVSEGILTWIHFLSLLSLFVYGPSIVAFFFGGVSLFLSLTITHCWYGLSRYPSIWNNLVPVGLKGSKLDENFAEIRDICSYFCNGNNRTKPQLGAFIFSLPFTFLYHFNAFVTTLAYYTCGVPTLGSRFPSPITLSIFISNIMMISLWLFGGKAGFIFTTAATIFNQNFYNSLLFKRSLKDFFLSFVLGNILVIQEKRLLTPHYEGKALNSTAYSTPRVLSTCGENPLPSRQIEEEKLDPERTAAETTTENEVMSLESSANSLVDQGSRDTFEIRISVHENRDIAPEINSRNRQSNPISENSVSRHKRRPLATARAESSEHEDGNQQHRQQQQQTVLNPKSLLFVSPKRTASVPLNAETIEIAPQSEFLNPSDVHFDVENHPGTLAFRSVITDAIEKFPMKAYTFRKHNWVLRKLQGRHFFVQEDGKRRKKIGRVEIKKRCKLFHDKQTALRSEIAGILSDLNDLKRNHTNSKSNSDHSRNSKTIPPESKEKMSGILKVDYRNVKKTKSNQGPDCSSTAKDSNVESYIESSKESTISTLTQSNGTFAGQTGARSTPWITGPTNDHKGLNETLYDGNHLRDAIIGLLEYTSWLENINPLRELKVSVQPVSGQPIESEENETNNKLAMRQESGILTEGTTGANTGGVEKDQDAYLRSFDERRRRKEKLFCKFPAKGFRKEFPSRGDQLPDTINCTMSFRKFVDTADCPTSSGRARIFPLWRRGLKKNQKNVHASNNKKDSSTKTARKTTRQFWKKRKRRIDLLTKPLTPESTQLSTTQLNSLESAFEGRCDISNRYDTVVKQQRSVHYNENGCVEERQDVSSPKSHLLPQYEHLLDLMNDNYFRQWEGTSVSDNPTRGHGRSKYRSTVPSVKESKNRTFGFCADNRCHAFDGIARACTSPNGSSVDDVYENE